MAIEILAVGVRAFSKGAPHLIGPWEDGWWFVQEHQPLHHLQRQTGQPHGSADKAVCYLLGLALALGRIITRGTGAVASFRGTQECTETVHMWAPRIRSLSAVVIGSVGVGD